MCRGAGGDGADTENVERWCWTRAPSRTPGTLHDEVGTGRELCCLARTRIHPPFSGAKPFTNKTKVLPRPPVRTSFKALMIADNTLGLCQMTQIDFQANSMVDRVSEQMSSLSARYGPRSFSTCGTGLRSLLLNDIYSFILKSQSKWLLHHQ